MARKKQIQYKALISADTRRESRSGNPAQIKASPALSVGQHCPHDYPHEPGPFPCDPEPSQAARVLGPPLNIASAAALIGVSPWTVRQKLLPLGLPHFRSGASGKLIFYKNQVIRWIGKQQERRNKRR